MEISHSLVTAVPVGGGRCCCGPVFMYLHAGNHPQETRQVSWVPTASCHLGPRDHSIDIKGYSNSRTWWCHTPSGILQLPHLMVSYRAVNDGLPQRRVRPPPWGRGWAMAVGATAAAAADPSVGAAAAAVAPLPGPAVPPAEAGHPGGQVARLARESLAICLRRQACPSLLDGELAYSGIWDLICSPN